MMANSRPIHNAILRKIAAITLFLVLGIVFAFSQDTKLAKSSLDNKNNHRRPSFATHFKRNCRSWITHAYHHQ